MATVNGTEYDHIDIVNGSTTTKHMLKDATARGDIENLKSAIDDVKTEIKRNNYYRLFDGNQTLKTYATRTLARADVPSTAKKLGLTIVYNLSNSNESAIIIEKFEGDGINDWSGDQFWKDLNIPSIYWGKLAQKNIHIENYVKKVISDKPLNIGIRMLWSNSTRKYSFAATIHTSDETAIKFVGRLDDIELPQTPGITVYTLTKYDSTDPEIKIVVDTYRLANESFNKSFYSYSSLNLASAYGSCAYVSVENNSEIEGIKTKAESDRNESNIYRLYDGAQTLKTYTTRTLARTDVPSTKRRLGLIIVYNLTTNGVTRVVEERFDGDGVNHWLYDYYWDDFSIPDLYWGYAKPIANIKNYVKQVICNMDVIVGLQFLYSLTDGTFSLLASLHNEDQSTERFIGRTGAISIASISNPTQNYVVELTKYDVNDPKVTVILDLQRLTTETIGSGFYSYASANLSGAAGSCVNTIIVNNDQNRLYETVSEAVTNRELGIFSVGENGVIGLKRLSGSYLPKDIEANYKSTLPNPKFPFIKSVSLHRLYDDAINPNMLYICSHSDKHIFYSICPTDTKHNDYVSDSEYAANYFYYADLSTPSNIIKVTLPVSVDGKSMINRIKYVFEMSNGDVLLEIENGSKYNTPNRHNNIYKIQNVFSGNTITENDCELSLSFDYRNEGIWAFDQICEYKAGYIVCAPYGSGATAKVYITDDYGDSWDLIFCGDNNNSTHSIKPKAEHLGADNSYGVWPTAEYLSGDPVDWTATGNNNIHIHGVAYDSWYNRIWICTGDGGSLEHNVTGVWWTDNDGYTWSRIGGKNEIGTQLMGIIPLAHCVLFSTDGAGDGFWRWSRNGKDKIIKIENCYNYLGTPTNLVMEAGRSIVSKNGFALTSFAPDNEGQGDWVNPGGIVATHNGFDFDIIYKDSFTQGTFASAEIGWSCDITDCGDKLILKADKGGYIQLDY